MANPWQYTGGYLDSETGLVKLGQRYYDPLTGRWTQLDPLGGGYTYASNNPTNFTDPTGLFTTDLDKIRGAANTDALKGADAGAVKGAIGGGIAGALTGPEGILPGAVAGAAAGAVEGGAEGAIVGGLACFLADKC